MPHSLDDLYTFPEGDISGDLARQQSLHHGVVYITIDAGCGVVIALAPAHGAHGAAS